MCEVGPPSAVQKASTFSLSREAVWDGDSSRARRIAFVMSTALGGARSGSRPPAVPHPARPRCGRAAFRPEAVPIVPQRTRRRCARLLPRSGRLRSRLQPCRPGHYPPGTWPAPRTGPLPPGRLSPSLPQPSAPSCSAAFRRAASRRTFSAGRSEGVNLGTSTGLLIPAQCGPFCQSGRGRDPFQFCRHLCLPGKIRLDQFFQGLRRLHLILPLAGHFDLVAFFYP